MSEYFVILTVQGILDGSLCTNFIADVASFETPTRIHALRWALAQLPPEVAGLPVVFFSVEPNNLAESREDGGEDR